MTPTILCKNPATDEVLGTVPFTEVETIPEVIQQARNAQALWKQTSWDTRAKHVLQLRNYLLEHADAIASVIAQSTGRSHADALNTELNSIILAANWYAKKSKHHLKPQRLPVSSILFSNKRTLLKRFPYGVIGIASPWNYPFSIPMHEIIMALMAGNAVLYKPAEETALVGLEIQKALAAAGFPDGLTHFMIGDPPAISSAWLKHGIDKLFFTGSVRVGKLLMEQASKTLTPVSLELGGNDAMLVFEDAPLTRAVNGALWAGLQNAGQTCAAVERVYVQQSIYDVFVAKLKESMLQLRQGVDDGSYNIDIGSLTVLRQKETVKQHVQDALDQGAKLEAQLPIPPNASPCFYPATLLTHVTHEMKVMKEETFGPVLAVMPFDTEAQAIAYANDSDLGLTSSIWTSRERALRIADQLETGVTTINDHLVTHGMAETPWVGWKHSGMGVTHSHLGLEEMTRPKVISYDLLPWMPFNLWWFPANPFKQSMVQALLSLLFKKGVAAKWNAFKTAVSSGIQWGRSFK